jgi:hypothetical protein
MTGTLTQRCCITLCWRSRFFKLPRRARRSVQFAQPRAIDAVRAKQPDRAADRSEAASFFPIGIAKQQKTTCAGIWYIIYEKHAERLPAATR